MSSKNIAEAARILRSSRYSIAFTGAGISVESGIPPFRGEGGVWNRYDPSFVEINWFLAHPLDSWLKLKEVFFDCMGNSEPNGAHLGLARLEEAGLLGSVITQNIDNLHRQAGSRKVVEFHGNSHNLVCTSCGRLQGVRETNLERLPPECPSCGELLKPDFVFFGEPIPPDASSVAFREAQRAEVVLVIGTTGEVMPAGAVPLMAKERGGVIIEINTAPSRFTRTVTDLFLEGRAAEIMTDLVAAMHL